MRDGTADLDPPIGPDDPPTGPDDPTATAGTGAPAGTYEPPRLIPLGHVREVTLGSLPNGKSDYNTQFFW